MTRDQGATRGVQERGRDPGARCAKAACAQVTLWQCFLSEADEQWDFAQPVRRAVLQQCNIRAVRRQSVRWGVTPVQSVGNEKSVPGTAAVFLENVAWLDIQAVHARHGSSVFGKSPWYKISKLGRVSPPHFGRRTRSVATAGGPRHRDRVDTKQINPSPTSWFDQTIKQSEEI